MKFVIDKALEEIKHMPFFMILFVAMIAAMFYVFTAFARADSVEKDNKKIKKSLEILSEHVADIKSAQLIPNIIMIHEQYCESDNQATKQQLLKIFETQQSQYKKLEGERYPVAACKEN